MSIYFSSYFENSYPNTSTSSETIFSTETQQIANFELSKFEEIGRSHIINSTNKESSSQGNKTTTISSDPQVVNNESVVAKPLEPKPTFNNLIVTSPSVDYTQILIGRIHHHFSQKTVSLLFFNIFITVK